MDGGVRVVQSMTFAPDGRSARHTVSSRKFMLNAATLEGTSHRVAVESRARATGCVMSQASRRFEYVR